MRYPFLSFYFRLKCNFQGAYQELLSIQWSVFLFNRLQLQIFGFLVGTWSESSPFVNHHDIVIKPDVPIIRKRHEIINKLQTVVAPSVFSPRALYDGKAIMYVSHELRLGAGGTGRASPVLQYTGVITLLKRSRLACVLTTVQIRANLAFSKYR